MASYTQQDILDKLDRIKNNKQRAGYMTPSQYQDFLPQTLGEQPKDQTLQYKILDQIHEKGTDATQLAQTIALGKAQRAAMIARRRELARAQKQYQQAQAAQPMFNPSVQGGNISVGNQFSGKVGTGKYLTTVNWRGRAFTVNRYAAPQFLGFLNSLAAAGYKPVSIGGYANRNIAGTNVQSLHALGLAIDIDPGKNPVGSNGNWHTSLPPNVAALAAKYGLDWGGSWHSYKDPMHFSVPYGGRQ